MKHIDVAYLWMQDEVRSKRLRDRRVKSEENAADQGAQPLSKSVIAKHCCALVYVDMTEEKCSMQATICVDVLGLRFGSQLATATAIRWPPVAACICSSHHSKEPSPQTSLGVRRGFKGSSFGHLAGGSAEERDFVSEHDHYREDVF